MISFCYAHILLSSTPQQAARTQRMTELNYFLLLCWLKIHYNNPTFQMKSLNNKKAQNMFRFVMSHLDQSLTEGVVEAEPHAHIYICHCTPVGQRLDMLQQVAVHQGTNLPLIEHLVGKHSHHSYQVADCEMLHIL